MPERPEAHETDRSHLGARLVRQASLFLALTLALLLVPMAGVAAADSVSISTDSDPVDGKPLRLTLSGELSNTTQQGHLFLSYKTTGGSGCGAYPDADGGRFIINWAFVDPGPYSDRESYSFDQGSYLLCAWLMDSGDSPGRGTHPLATAAALLTVRPIHASLALRVPASVGLNVPFVINGDYMVELDRSLYMIIKPTGGTGCAASFSLEPGYSTITSAGTVVSGDTLSGTNTDRASYTLRSYGSYLLCAWIEKTSGDLEPTVGPIAATVTALAPACAWARHTENLLYRNYSRLLNRARHARGHNRARLFRAANHAKSAWKRARSRRRAACALY